MHYLILNILFSSCFILCIKWVQSRKLLDVVTVGSVNYIAAALCAIPAFLSSTPSPQIQDAIWTGGTMGTCYFVAFFFLIYAVHWVGASNSAAVSRVSLVIPICLGIWLWNESPDLFQVVGIGLAFGSLFLIGRTSSKSIHAKALAPHTAPTADGKSVPVEPWKVISVLGIFFLICGASRVMQQTCKQLCDGVADYPAFLLAAFICAAVPSVVVLVWRRKSISTNELIVGFLLGVTNILQSHYILRSLDLFDGFLVFTITSTGGLVTTTAVAVFYFKEKLNRQSVVGIGLAAFSIIFLQVPIAALLSNSV